MQVIFCDQERDLIHLSLQLLCSDTVGVKRHLVRRDDLWRLLQPRSQLTSGWLDDLHRILLFAEVLPGYDAFLLMDLDIMPVASLSYQPLLW